MFCCRRNRLPLSGEAPQPRNDAPSRASVPVLDPEAPPAWFLKSVHPTLHRFAPVLLTEQASSVDAMAALVVAACATHNIPVVAVMQAMEHSQQLCARFTAFCALRRGAVVCPWLDAKDLEGAALAGTCLALSTIVEQYSWHSTHIRGTPELAMGCKGSALGEFSYPNGLALTPDDRFLLVADRSNRRIVVADARSGETLHVLVGPPRTLLVTPWLCCVCLFLFGLVVFKAQCLCLFLLFFSLAYALSVFRIMQEPRGVCVAPASGRVWVCDRERHRVIGFAAVDDDTVIGEMGATTLTAPRGVAVLDRQRRGSVVVVTDTFNHRLALFDEASCSLIRHVGAKGTDAGQFLFPYAVVTHPYDDVLVVGDAHRVQILTPEGQWVRNVGAAGPLGATATWAPTGSAMLGYLSDQLFGLAVSLCTNELLVVDGGSNRVNVFRWDDGSFVRAFGKKGKELGSLDAPVGVAVSQSGEVWVSDCMQHRVCLFR